MNEQINEVDEMKPCPFCGGKPMLDIWEMIPWEKYNLTPNDGKWYSVYCDECFSEGSHELTKEEAIKKWNKRV